uniref:Uncharacterized protein n=1 Tax=Anopheles atroparvus TaxID=41427 RepID=A0A182J093_ANOAO
MKFWTRYLKRKEKLFRVQYKTPAQLFERACEKLIWYFAFCGCERMRADYTRRNARFIFLMTDLILYLAVNMYSIALAWGSLIDVVFCFVTMGVAIQGLTKMFAFSSPEMYELHMYNVRRLEEPARFPEVEDSRFHTATMCRVFIRILVIGFSLVGIVIHAYAFLMPLYKRELLLAFGFYLPFIDFRSPVGFTINWLYQSVQVVEGCIGLLACDTCLLFFIVHASGQMDQIIIYLRRLTELIESRNGNEQREAQIKELIGEIVQKHLEHTNRFVSDMDILLRKQFFINFGCMIFELVASLAILVRSPWYPGMAIVLICTMQLFISCALGTYISIQNDTLVDKIYHVNWYGLSTKHQKTLQQVLLCAQRPVVLSDGFTAIDLRYFVEVQPYIYKKIYSYLMVLQNGFGEPIGHRKSIVTLTVKRRIEELAATERFGSHQRTADRATEEECGILYFLYAPGGTGKSFLLEAILAYTRRQTKTKIALAEASSGIGDGRHPTFPELDATYAKLPRDMFLSRTGNLQGDVRRLLTASTQISVGNISNPDFLPILFPRNVDVTIINNSVLERLPEPEEVYLSVGTLVNQEEQQTLLLPTELLNSLNMSIRRCYLSATSTASAGFAMERGCKSFHSDHTVCMRSSVTGPY